MTSNPLVLLAYLTVLLAAETATAPASFCRKINRYENGLPSTLKTFSKNDALGPTLTLVHQLYVAAVHSAPTFEDECKSVLVQFGKYDVKASLRPIGCCAHCCLIRDPRDHLAFYFSNPSTTPELVKFGLERKRGRLKSLGLDSDAPTVIFIPGFTENGNSLNSRMIREAYSSRNESYNILTMDWGDYTAVPWYFEAVDNAKIVGVELAKFLKFYDKTGELPLKNLHVVGFSLGAHVSGYAGKEMKKMGTMLPRITGLEPANPLYNDEDAENRISKDDARYVDIIHTDPGKYGMKISLGHADFYPNYDLPLQPGCELVSLTENKALESFTACEHLRAVELFAESVKNPIAFPAVKVKAMGEEEASTIRRRRARFATSAYMGFAATKDTTQGDFYLITNNHRPYGKPAGGSR